MSDLEKTKPAETKKESGVEKQKKIVQQDILDLSRDEEIQRMKDRYGETKDSFIKGIRSSEDYGNTVKHMTDKEVLDFAQTESSLREYQHKYIEPKKSNEAKNTPNKESDQKKEEPKKGPDKAPDKKPDEKKEPKKTEDKPKEIPTEPQKEPDKSPDKKPDEKKEPQKVDKKDVGDKKPGKSFRKATGDIVTYLPKQAWKATKVITKGVWSATKWTTHQTGNLIKYPFRTTRSTVKFARQYMDHGFSKGRREKNKGAYFDKWKWEQGKGKK